MNNYANQPGGRSNGSDHHGGGGKDDRKGGRKGNRKGDRKGDRKSSKHADRRSGSEDAQSASSSRDHQYRPQHDPHYAEVARPIRNNYAHLANAMNNPALNVGFGSPYGVAQASPSAGDAVHHSFGSGFNAPQGGQAHPAEANQAQHIWYPPQVTQISQQTPGYDHTGPYNAVGYVPVNGEIHDRSELYEEYRLSEHGEELNEDDSDSWYNVKAHASY